MRLPVAVDPPRFLFMEVNQRCNLRCGHCDFWKRNDKDRARYLSPERQREIIDEFAELGGSRLVICGGEPMLDSEVYYHLAHCGRAAGLHVLSVVNGTRITTEAEAERAIAEGPHEISVSFDDHREAEHDMHRGISGAWQRSVRAVRLLAAARDKLGTGKVHIMGLVHAGNHAELEDFYEFAFGLGADKLKLNMLQPRFGQSSSRDDYLPQWSQLDVDVLMQTLDRCEARYGIGYSSAWLADVRTYWESIQGSAALAAGWHGAARISRPLCNSGERNVMVDHYGYAKLCFSSAFRGYQLEERGDLKAMWYGLQSTRERMASCRMLCGISHSVRRNSATTSTEERTQPCP